MLLGKGREPVGRREAFICMRANRRYHEKGGPETKRGIPLGGGERPTGGEGTGRDGVGGRQQRVIWDTKASGRNGRGAPPALFLFLLFPSCLIGAFMVGIVHGRVGGRVRRWKDRIFFRPKGHESDTCTGTASCQVTLEKNKPRPASSVMTNARATFAIRVLLTPGLLAMVQLREGPVRNFPSFHPLVPWKGERLPQRGMP